LVPDSLAARLIDAIAARDEPAIAACFADDAELRALIPSGLRERSGAAEAASLIVRWFADSTEFDLLDSHSDEIADRLHLSYRFAGVEEDEPYVVEQQIFCTVSDGRIDRADVLCSGFRPRQAQRPSRVRTDSATRPGAA
jgi:hypothetical protein